MIRINTIRRILWVCMSSAAIVSACSGLSPQVTPTEEPIQEEIQPLISATGKVVPSHWSRLSINILGVVEEILVEEGDQVQKDQVLLRLQGKEDFQAAIETAKLRSQHGAESPG